MACVNTFVSDGWAITKKISHYTLSTGQTIGREQGAHTHANTQAHTCTLNISPSHFSYSVDQLPFTYYSSEPIKPLGEVCLERKKVTHTHTNTNTHTHTHTHAHTHTHLSRKLTKCSSSGERHQVFCVA